jgi:regulator of sirC expression with transglutaminase-like and TPR domain
MTDTIDTIDRSPEPAPSRAELREALRSIGVADDGDIDLAESALWLAALDCPGVALGPYRSHLAEIGEQIKATARRSASVAMQAAALRSVLAGRFGYQGDVETYDDVRNANLIHVIDRRRGLPVALGILYLHAGAAYGADIRGLNFPQHFLLRLTARGQRLIVDPFAGGQGMAASELRQRLKELVGPDAEMEPVHYREVGSREILIRLQNNIKTRAIAAGNLARAVQVLETMTLIDPHGGSLWWELAVLHSRLGNVRTAIATLEGFLSSGADPSGRDRIEDLLQRLRGHLH